jgi:hypothetical protein
MLDTAILVVGEPPVEVNGNYYMTVRWFKRNGLDLNRTENVVIKRKEVKNWYKI